jgi:hypothetical protein
MARGALAGLVGGLALTAAERLVAPRLPGYGKPRRSPWDRRVRTAAGAMGLELDARTARIASDVARVAYATAVGAAYGAAIGAGRPSSRASRNFVDAGLGLAASVMAPEPGRRSNNGRRPVRNAIVGQLGDRLLSPALFERTTSALLSALLR